MRGAGGNHHEKLGLEKILCASQCTIPDMAGTSADPAGYHTDMTSLKPNPVTHTPDVSY